MMSEQTKAAAPQSAEMGGLDMLLEVARHARLVVVGGLAAGVLAVGLSYLVRPTFSASTVLLPPQQQQSAAASALSSLGALAGLAGGAAGVRTQLDQYVSILLSRTVADRMIERFQLSAVYEEPLLMDVRRVFWTKLRVTAGRRDGLITIEVDDHEPKRAAEMAAAMVEEFRRITSEIAITEAQQRKVFFEKHLADTRDRLAAAQRTLQDSGLSAGSLKAEPKAAAEGYARLQAEATAAQVKLQALLSSLTANAPEVQQQQAVTSALRQQLARAEASTSGEGSDYISKYREFKYQETLFELFSRQFELARVDESREGGLIQVVDAAVVPEKKIKPRRSIVGLVTSVLCGLGLLGFVLLRWRWRLTASEASRSKLGSLGLALRGKA